MKSLYSSFQAIYCLVEKEICFAELSFLKIKVASACIKRQAM
jgi:hypothetical protein